MPSCWQRDAGSQTKCQSGAHAGARAGKGEMELGGGSPPPHLSQEPGPCLLPTYRLLAPPGSPSPVRRPGRSGRLGWTSAAGRPRASRNTGCAVRSRVFNVTVVLVPSDGEVTAEPPFPALRSP